MRQDQSIHVMIVDDEDLVRFGIGSLLTAAPGIDVVASCRTVDEALAALQTAEIDVIVFDSQLSTQPGMNVMDLCKQRGFTGAFVLLGTELTDVIALAALRKGATGIVLKSDDPDKLVQAIRKVAEGGCWVPDHYIKVLATASAPNHRDRQKPLSDREITVLRSICQGSTNKEIANELGISESAVKSSIQHLFEKTGTRSRSQLVIVAMDRFSKYL